MTTESARIDLAALFRIEIQGIPVASPPLESEGGPMADIGTRTDWVIEEEYWRENYQDRPYVTPDRDFGYYSPGYRFGYDATERYPNKSWNDVESDLRRDWARYEHRGQSTWEQMKSAVKDAWDRMTGNR
jgi:hypothetical protein